MHKRLCHCKVPDGTGGEGTGAADGAVGGTRQFDVERDVRRRVEGYSVERRDEEAGRGGRRCVRGRAERSREDNCQGVGKGAHEGADGGGKRGMGRVG